MHCLLQASLRAAVRRRRDVESVGPFLAVFDPDDANPFRNYAVPDDDANPTPAQVEELCRAFRRRERLPRLEFLPAIAPAVEPALLNAGFVTEARLPIMTCTAAQLRQTPPPPGVDLVIITGREALSDAAAVQNAAYDAPPPTETDITRLQNTVAAGGVVALARHANGQAIGSGLVTAASDGLAELAAVGVLVAWRRQGLAAALSGALAQAAFGSGTKTLTLQTYETEQSIYARAGFTVASEIIFVSTPA